MEEQTLRDRVTRVEADMEHVMKAQDDFREETREDLSDIRKDTKNIMRMAIIGLASLATVVVVWGLTAAVGALNGQ